MASSTTKDRPPQFTSLKRWKFHSGWAASNSIIAERSPETVARWQRAVALADTLAYNEPADWFYPLRHYLGAALLDAGRAREAEAVYRADLARNPNNGWAYFGLWKSLAAQKKRVAARKAERDYLDAWAFADFELERTAF